MDDARMVGRDRLRCRISGLVETGGYVHLGMNAGVVAHDRPAVAPEVIGPEPFERQLKTTFTQHDIQGCLGPTQVTHFVERVATQSRSFPDLVHVIEGRCRASRSPLLG